MYICCYGWFFVCIFHGSSFQLTRKTLLCSWCLPEVWWWCPSPWPDDGQTLGTGEQSDGMLSWPLHVHSHVPCHEMRTELSQNWNPQSIIPSFHHSIQWIQWLIIMFPFKLCSSCPFPPLNTPNVAINWGHGPLWDPPAQSARTRSLPGIAVTRRRSGAANCQRRRSAGSGLSKAWSKWHACCTYVEQL